MIKMLLLFLLTSFSFNAYSQENTTELVWFTNFEKASEEAEKTNKVILLEFTGSDWCSHCKRIEKDLFSTDEFKEFATKELVLLKADFPMKRSNKALQTKEDVAHNEALAEKYNPKGTFPTVLVLKGEKLIGRLSYPLNSSQDYLNELSKIIK